MGKKSYWSFREKAFSNDGGQPKECRGETVLAAFMVWSWHQDAVGPYLADAMARAELMVAQKTYVGYRSTLRARFADVGLQLWEVEDGDLGRGPLTLVAQLPSDLADLLTAYDAGDARSLRKLVGDGGQWSGFKRTIRSHSRGPWATALIKRIETIEHEHAERIAAQRVEIPAEPPTAAPPSPGHLFGREEERERIDAGLACGKVVVLHGTARLGKTALAAATVADFTGKVLWIELKERARAEIGVVMATLDADQGGRVDDLVELLRARLHTYGETLLVLDDVARSARDLVARLHELRADGLRLIVTSHVRLGLDPSVECAIPVRPLRSGRTGTHDDPAVALFETTVQERAERLFDDDERVLITRLCETQGRHPLRIKLAAGLLLQGRTLAELCEIAAQSSDLQDAIQHGFDSLPELQRDVLAGLSVFGDAFDLLTAAEVIEEEPDKLWAAVELLVGTFVLDDAEGGDRKRFRLEESVRVPAAEALQQAGREADCRARLLADLSTRLGYELRTSRAEWLTRVARESAGATAFLETMLPLPVAATDEQVLGIVTELVPYWVGHGLYEDGRRMLTEAQKKLRRETSARTRAGVLNGRALLAWVQGERAIAERAFREASRIAGSGARHSAEACLGLGLVGDDEAQLELASRLAERATSVHADASVALGWRAYHLSDYQTALTLFERGATSAEEACEERCEGDALIGAGWVRRRLCDFAGAAVDFDVALDRGRVLKDRTLIAQALNARGELARAYGDHETAWRELDEAKQLVDLGAASIVRARVLGSRGELRRASATNAGELREARRELTGSLGEVEGKLPTQAAWRHFGLGLVAFMLGTTDIARGHFRDSLDLAKLHGDRWQAARSRHQLARLELADGNLEGAVPELIAAARKQDELGVLDDLGWTLQDLAHAAHRLGDDRLTATLTGARMGIEECRLKRAPRRILRSAPCDRYADELEAACARAHERLGPGWDEAFAAGGQYVARSYRPMGQRIRLRPELLALVEQRLGGDDAADAPAAA